jgi:hypothetical protein
MMKNVTRENMSTDKIMLNIYNLFRENKGFHTLLMAYVKVKLSLCTMKTYWACGSIAPPFLISALDGR